MTSTAQPVQPKTVQRMLLRSALGLLTLAALVVGYQALKSCGQDIDLPAHVGTVGAITAVQFGDGNTRVVLFDTDGKMREAPGYKPGKNERDATWRPDGNRIFFVSDREENTFNVFRWNPGSDAVERKSIGQRSKFLPTFVPGDQEASQTMLIIAGGFVLELDPVSGDTQQVLPPVVEQTAGAEGESGRGQLEGAYQRLGTSFKQAKWTKDKRHVAAVMRREDGSELLIVQNITEAKAPLPVVAGHRIDFDVSPKTNEIFFTVLNFEFPEPEKVPSQFIKNGKIVPPFRHLIGVVNADDALAQVRMVGATHDDKIAFHRVSVSPDGSMLLLVTGRFSNNSDLVPDGLDVCPSTENGGRQASRVTKGKIYEPSWGPDSNKIAFIRVDDSGKRAIHTISRNGSEETDVSKDKGNFSWPRISPQLPGQ